MRHIGILVFCLLLTIGNAQALKVYLLSYHDNVGDHNVAKGIGRALTQLSEVTPDDIDVKAEGPQKIRDQINTALKQDQVIVIGTGEGGLEGVKDLSEDSNLIVGLTSHIPLAGFKNPALLKKVRFIALPTHTTGKETEALGDKLFVTTGVAHNRSAKDAEGTYESWKAELPTSDSYLGVVLGGDAPTPSKEIKLFTIADAIKLANYVTKTANGACVLVLNGPRTGKHDDNKVEIASAHRSGQMDQVTKEFVAQLKSKLGESRVKLFDFQHGQKPPYNSFDLVMGAVMTTNGKMLIPGESTSMVSEAVDTLPSGQVIVYGNSAMNNLHQAHVKSEFEAGRVAVLREDQQLETADSQVETTKMSAAESIAKRLWDFVNRS